MKILLFGGSGQLGSDLISKSRGLNFDVFYPISAEADISDREQVFRLIAKVSPDVVINSAAYTAVDKAEVEQAEALKINAEGAANIASACNKYKSRLIHISTDYVFGEGFSSPILEDAKTLPLNVYGKTKLEGERRVLEETSGEALVVRISSLHGKKGINFVHTMLSLFAEKKELKIVNDIYMSPTYASWLAEALLDLARIKCSGLLHASCAGSITWFDFATEILKLTKDKIPNAQNLNLIPVPASEFPRPATRASYSVLNTNRLAGLLDRNIISWKEGLADHLKELNH